jgi:hypothetical protein
MGTLIDSVIVGGALLASLGGLVLLWRGWRDGRQAWPRLAAAMALWIASIGLWIAGFGPEVGIPLALETSALIAFGFILSRIERRTGRAPRQRTASLPEPPRRNILLGTARVLVAGPLGLISALGIAVVIATAAPMAEQTRLILAGLIVPSLWCGAIAWIVCQRRLPVQAAAFAGLGIGGFGLTFLIGA